MSFWELVVIAVVALLVLGPERLPGAIRSVSGFVRSVKQFGQQMQAELNDELRVQELHDKLKQAEEKGLLNLTTEEMQAMAELRVPDGYRIEMAVAVGRTHGQAHGLPEALSEREVPSDRLPIAKLAFAGSFPEV